MRTHPLPRLARSRALTVLAAAGLTLGGITALVPAATAAAATSLSAAGPARQYGSSTQVGVCGKGPHGTLVNCPPPVAESQLPPGAKNTSPVTQPVGNLAALVDTRTWTTGGGNTFPGADVPFGMVQWSPDTLPHRSDGGGYSFTDTTLDGYSLTHLSGPGCGAAGDVPILPMTGPLPSGNPNDVVTPFSHTGEVAQAGYYSAQSNQPDTITSQFTATPHSAMGRFTFPATTQADFLIKLMGSQTRDFAATAHIVGTNEITGSDTSGHFCGRTSKNSNGPERYTVHFSIVFSQPFTASQIITPAGQTSPSAVFLTFDTTANPVIEAKVGISYVSSANAQLNWQTENPGWDFTNVTARAQATWNTLLHKIDVYGGSYARTQEFYSLLYKDFLQPNITSDVNGQYLGSDFKVHTLSPGQQNQYGIYSGWDIYHSLAQLQAILDPQAASDMAQSLVNYYSQNAILQRWGYLNLDTYVMAGDPAQAIIADYYAFGARNFNTTQALTDMLKQATTTNNIWPGQALLDKYGYLPVNASYGCCNVYGIAASLLEYDNADFALSQYAAALGDTRDAAMLARRANNWQNEFDVANSLITPRLQNGTFVSGITPTTSTDYIEGDAGEYLWDVPGNYAGLFSLLGGNSTVTPMLQKYLSKPNGFGNYAELTNEFDLGEQNALDYAGDPAGTQAAVANIRNTMYLPGPSGLANNDDLGAESSQFIWEMLGMYPENPGSGNLVFASPGFPHAVIHLANGNAINITANGASPTEYYVKSLTINNQPYNKLYVPFSTLTSGATLTWGMSTTPTTWGSAPQDAPPSYQQGMKPVLGFLPSQQVTVTPGGTTTLRIGARNATNSAQTVQVSVSAAAGVTVTPSSGTIQVPASGSGYLPVTVQAAAATPQTFYPMPITLTTSSAGTTSTQTLNSTVLVAQPGSLLAAFDNAGISSNSDVSAANFDNDGNSYSAQALAAAGLSAGQSVTVNGVPFTWPLPAPGYPDNAIAGGQQVTVNAPVGTQKIGFLGSATNGPSEGVATLHYSDGTSVPFWLGFSDWTLNAGRSKPSYGNKVVAHMSYRNCAACSNGTNNVGTNVFYTSLPVIPAKTLISVTLPSSATAGALHIFAVGTSTQAKTPPVVTSLSPATASAGQQVTVNGTGFGATQGTGFVAFSSQGINWGAPGNAATFHIDSWSNTAVTFTVPTPSGAGGAYHVSPGTIASVTVVNSSGGISDSPVLQITATANPADYYDNTGISPDSNQSCANYDGDGTSYSANALAADGITPGSTITADGLTFTWPDVAACSPDNILASGQTMLVNGKAGATTLGLIGSSTNGASQGTIVINYTDGTSSTATVSFNDWAGGPGNGDVAVATMPYRNQISGGSQTLTMYVYATTVPVNPAKTVASITFPDVSSRVASGVTAMHIFAVSLG